MMDKHYEIIGKLINISNTLERIGKLPRDFGIGIMLYPSEIHTIEAISACDSINANALSKVLGITNGAVTQMTDKLVKKGLIEKYRIDSNKKEIYFKLTEFGEAADQAHDDFHAQAYKNMAEYLDKLRPNQIKAITGFLDVYIENLPND